MSTTTKSASWTTGRSAPRTSTPSPSGVGHAPALQPAWRIALGRLLDTSAPEPAVAQDVWWAVWYDENDEEGAHRRAFDGPIEANAFLDDHGYDHAWIEQELVYSDR